MGDRQRLAQREDGEDRRIRHPRRVVEGVLDPHAGEAMAGAVVSSDDEDIGAEGVQNTARVIKEPEGFVAGVGEGGDKP